LHLQESSSRFTSKFPWPNLSNDITDVRQKWVYLSAFICVTINIFCFIELLVCDFVGVSRSPHQHNVQFFQCKPQLLNCCFRVGNWPLQRIAVYVVCLVDKPHRRPQLSGYLQAGRRYYRQAACQAKQTSTHGFPF
tara:strand:- start:459 stop:866 length:408 start_codon:yes stop_codon:yes gene_type:complete